MRRLANYEPPLTGQDIADQRYDAMAERFRDDTDRLDGVYRWKRSGNCVPDECMAEMFRRDLVTDLERTVTRRAARRDSREFVAEYRRNQPDEPTSEERAEARAAFGPGEEVVDVLSGRRYAT